VASVVTGSASDPVVKSTVTVRPLRADSLTVTSPGEAASVPSLRSMSPGTMAMVGGRSLSVMVPVAVPRSTTAFTGSDSSRVKVSLSSSSSESSRRGTDTVAVVALGAKVTVPRCST
jgi:hypothetical protein